MARSSRWGWIVVVCLGLLGISSLSWGTEGDNQSTVARPQIEAAYGKLPLTFEANRGQVDQQVKYLSRGRGYTLFLTQNEAVIQLRNAGACPERSRRSGVRNLKWEPLHSSFDLRPYSVCHSAVVRMQMVGADPAPEVIGEVEQTGKVNYLKGERSQWRTNVPTYGQVRYRSIYPGVDLVYHSTPQGKLEYDFVVAPGVDPKTIRLAFAGLDKKGDHIGSPLRIDATGDLFLQTAGGELRLRKPHIYQEIDGVKHPIAGHYLLLDSETPDTGLQTSHVGFAVAAYDATKPLIIDPILDYSTYLGGSSDDSGASIAVDTMNRAYVTGFTSSTDFPTPNALDDSLNSSLDAFVARLSADGSSLEYATYLGGNDFDAGFGIAVDTVFRAYVTGGTSSTDFPTTPSALDDTSDGFSDAFVARLSADGSSLEYATYLGGDSYDLGTGIAVDTLFRAYVQGLTGSSDFPTPNALYDTRNGNDDAFVARLSANGLSLDYATYLGGSSNEFGAGIAVDTVFRAYVTGQTNSNDFPTANPLQGTSLGDAEAYVARLSFADGPQVLTLDYSTYLGGSDFAVGTGIAVDTVFRAYVTGGTGSTDFPTTNALDDTLGGSRDAFVTRLSFDDGPQVLTRDYSTYLGGSGSDFGTGIAVDTSHRAYVAGNTSSTDFPTPHALDDTLDGSSDVFVARLSADGLTLHYATYLGGSGSDVTGATGLELLVPGAIAVDASARAYVIGTTRSTDFPTVNALDGTLNDGPPDTDSDAFVVRLTPCGDGELDTGEQCDDSNLEDGDCCSSTCQFESSETVCRTAAGACDTAEVCTGASGTCPADLKSTAQCRESAGLCDVAESCDGVSNDCPADALQPNTFECRGSAGACDVAEQCTGSSAACPDDALQPNTFECRGSAGACDVAEQCTGSSAACPDDAFQPNTFECRSSAGICDVAEQCTGGSAACPADLFQPNTFECRSATGECDLAETCTGGTASCPADGVKPNGTLCTDDVTACTRDICDGVSKVCTHPPVSASSGCLVNGKFNQPCQGTAGLDIILGTLNNDVIQGGSGNDIIDGLSGNDVVCGGEGNDTLRGGPGTDSLDGGPGNDNLDGGLGFDALNGGPGTDFLNGGAPQGATCVNGETNILCAPF